MSASLRQTFARLRKARRPALIPFVMGGDPDLATTAALLPALERAGADVIEVGVPFSDPLADGPTIQRAAFRALQGGVTPERLLRALAPVARRVTAPIVLLSYWNPILQFGRGASRGPAAFAEAAEAAGIAGVIVPDLPPDEADGFPAAARRRGVSPIFLAAPTSPTARLRRIAAASDGFIYYVSLTGTTGARRQLSADWKAGVRQLKRLTPKPVCVGFGISTPAQAAEVAQAADGVIIGSALIRALEPAIGRGPEAAARRAEAFLAPFRWALR
jgi:tryptophan synthase alpha chain